jgi:hypothetical protein
LQQCSIVLIIIIIIITVIMITLIVGQMKLAYRLPLAVKKVIL